MVGTLYKKAVVALGYESEDEVDAEFLDRTNQ